MDHNEAIREFQRLLERQAEYAHTAANELLTLVSLLPNENTRRLAQEQAKASHKQAREFRDLAQKVKEN
jgi:hypothetical protein